MYAKVLSVSKPKKKIVHRLVVLLMPESMVNYSLSRRNSLDIAGHVNLSRLDGAMQTQPHMRVSLSSCPKPPPKRQSDPMVP